MPEALLSDCRWQQATWPGSVTPDDSLLLNVRQLSPCIYWYRPRLQGHGCLAGGQGSLRRGPGREAALQAGGHDGQDIIASSQHLQHAYAACIQGITISKGAPEPSGQHDPGSYASDKIDRVHKTKTH